MLESVETLNCGNYSLRPGRVVALFQAQAGAGGERTNERKKNMQDKLGGEGYHAGATAVSLLPRLHAETAANARPGGLRESHKEAHWPLGFGRLKSAAVRSVQKSHRKKEKRGKNIQY